MTTNATLNELLNRLKLLYIQYHYTLKLIPGKDNIIADVLTRKNATLIKYAIPLKIDKTYKSEENIMYDDNKD